MKKVANTDSLFSTARMHVGSVPNVFPTKTTPLLEIKKAKKQI